MSVASAAVSLFGALWLAAAATSNPPAPPVAAPTAAPMAATKKSPLSSGPINTKLPVEIGAESAHLEEEKHTITLSGHFSAKQGEIELKADKATVTYSSKGGEKAQAPAAGGMAGTIERILAEGNVSVTRPGETVRSNTATYDVAAEKILMTGNVVATRDKNVVHGEHLVVDLASQRLDMSSPGGRVQGIFVPASANKKP